MNNAPDVTPDSTSVPVPQVFCVTCRYFTLTDETVGNCHRRAPTRNLECTLCCWPPVPVLEWCGEHEPANKASMTERKEAIKEAREQKKEVK